MNRSTMYLVGGAAILVAGYLWMQNQQQADAARQKALADAAKATNQRNDPSSIINGLGGLMNGASGLVGAMGGMLGQLQNLTAKSGGGTGPGAPVDDRSSGMEFTLDESEAAFA